MYLHMKCKVLNNNASVNHFMTISWLYANQASTPIQHDVFICTQHFVHIHLKCDVYYRRNPSMNLIYKVHYVYKAHVLNISTNFHDWYLHVFLLLSQLSDSYVWMDVKTHSAATDFLCKELYVHYPDLCWNSRTQNILLLIKYKWNCQVTVMYNVKATVKEGRYRPSQNIHLYFLNINN